MNATDPRLHSAESISARLDRLPPTKTIWKFVILISFGVFFELYDLLYTAYIAPGLIAEGILTTTTSSFFGMTGIASFIAALFSGLFIGTIACGFLSDKFGRKAIFTYSLLWYVAANFMMAFADSAASLNFWRFIVGLGIGVEMVTISAYLSEMVPKKIRGRAFACCHAIGFTAVPIVAFLAYWLVPLKPFGFEGWRWIVIIGCHGAIFIWWIRRELPESPRWLAMKGRLSEADQIMSDIEAKVLVEYGKPLPKPADAFPISNKARLRDIWQPPYRKRAIMMIVFNFFQTIGYYGFANWVPTLLMQQGITVTSSLMYSSIIAIAAPIGPLIGLYIGDRFERKHVIVILSAINIICGLLFSQMSHFVLLISMGIGLMLTGNMISYSYHAYQAELFPTAIRARTVGFVYSWSRFSAIFSGFMIAEIVKWFGVLGVFIFISMTVVITMLAIGLLGPKTKDLALEAISNE
jgi:putative MFS transporter